MQTSLPNVSFLLGSGFSIPDGLPSVGDLNARLSKVTEDEIIITSSQDAFFLNGQFDNNRFVNVDKRLFFQFFLEFYNNQVLLKGQNFHYETFYDFYSGYLHSKENADIIEDFYDSFTARYPESDFHLRDCYNRVNDFNNTFNQLLVGLLHQQKYHQEVSFSGYQNYGVFFNFIGRLLESHQVKVHSLNHDLLFDYVAQHHEKLWAAYCDGFELAGSPFYGKLEYYNPWDRQAFPVATHYVKLPHFTNKFDKQLAFFKLHGSINTRIIHSTQVSNRVKHAYGISEYAVERFDNENGRYSFEFAINSISPDFLSGTTTKTRSYTNGDYYPKLFEHFANNLTSATILIVVGYGFQDPGINQFLEQYYLSRGGAMYVIDPGSPRSGLLQEYEHTHIKKSIADLETTDLPTI